MADTQVESAPSTVSGEASLGLQGPYWISPSVGLIVFIDSGNDISFTRTTDGGINWTKTEIEAGTTQNFACWFDQETPGDTGTIVNCTWLDSSDDEAKYCTIDVSDGTVGTIRTIDSGITVSSTNTLNRTAITKTVSGNIIVSFSTQTEIECYKSDDLFATAGTKIDDPFETATEEDWLLLFPANTADDNDACGIFWDRDVYKVSLKMYDDSADTWTETPITPLVDVQDFASTTYMNMDASVRHSDNHIFLAYHYNDDTVADDMKTWDLTVDSIASPTVTSKTKVFNDVPESAQVGMIINQQNDDIYVAYLKGGTWLATTDVVFHKSTDGGANWGAEQAYNETTDDYRVVHGGRTIGNSGGRIQWTWYDDDSTDIWVNLVNDIEIAAFGVGTNMQINIGDVWKDVPLIKINIGDVWKDVVGVQQNIGDVWKDVF